jgi:hypothetical protein
VIAPQTVTEPEHGGNIQWHIDGTMDVITVHRAMPSDPATRREMHRTTIVGEEAIQ